jgi:phosphohistidine phosphatase
MKIICLVRHARATWPNAAMADFERPLANRGHAEAESMSQHLLRQRITPDLLVSSPARRALETAEIFADATGFNRNAIVRKIELYEGGVESLSGVIRSLEEENSCVLLFGHNPTISALVRWLTGHPSSDMDTCGIAKIDLQGDCWQDTTEACGRLDWYDYPEKR